MLRKVQHVSAPDQVPTRLQPLFNVIFSQSGAILTLQSVATMHVHWGTRTVALLEFLAAALCIVGRVCSWLFLIKPTHTFNDEDPADAFKQLIGGFFVCILAPLTVSAVAIGIKLLLEDQPGPRVRSHRKGRKGQHQDGLSSYDANAPLMPPMMDGSADGSGLGIGGGIMAVGPLGGAGAAAPEANGSGGGRGDGGAY